MYMLLVALVIAVIVEALVDYGKVICDAIRRKKCRKMICYGIMLAISLAFSFLVGVTIFCALCVPLCAAWVDMLFSGIFIARIANYLYCLCAKSVCPKPKDPCYGPRRMA
jgi:hypothetical protein